MGDNTHGSWDCGAYRRPSRVRIAYPGIYNLKGCEGQLRPPTYAYNCAQTNNWDSTATQWYTNQRYSTPYCDGCAWVAKWSRRYALSGSTAGAGFQAAGWEAMEPDSNKFFFSCANYDGA